MGRFKCRQEVRHLRIGIGKKERMSTRRSLFRGAFDPRALMAAGPEFLRAIVSRVTEFKRRKMIPQKKGG